MKAKLGWRAKRVMRQRAREALRRFEHAGTYPPTKTQARKDRALDRENNRAAAALAGEVAP